MAGLNNISGSSAPPIQHDSSQASTPARLVIRTVDQARDHLRTITSRSQAFEAMAELELRSGAGIIDEETYRLLANTLRDIYNSFQERETAQAQSAHLPVRPPAPGWQATTIVSAATLAAAVTAIQQGATVEQAAQQHGIRDIFDRNTLDVEFGRQQNPRVSAATFAAAVTAIQQGATAAQAAQQHDIRDINQRINLDVTFERQNNPSVSAETLAAAVTDIRQGATVEQAAQQHGIRDMVDMATLRFTFSDRG